MLAALDLAATAAYSALQRQRNETQGVAEQSASQNVEPSLKTAGDAASDPPAPEWEQCLADPAEAGAFPAENPNPVFRVSADGKLLYANRASRTLMAAWGVVGDCRLPAVWRARIARALAAAKAGQWDEPCGDRLLQLNCVPIVDAAYVNVYASDVTERAALVAELAEERRQLAEAAASAQSVQARLCSPCCRSASPFRMILTAKISVSIPLRAHFSAYHPVRTYRSSPTAPRSSHSGFSTGRPRSGGRRPTPPRRAARCGSARHDARRRARRRIA